MMQRVTRIAVAVGIFVGVMYGSYLGRHSSTTDQSQVTHPSSADVTAPAPRGYAPDGTGKTVQEETHLN